jgi:glycosyltransferase involved in cell wall biosynthesis
VKVRIIHQYFHPDLSSTSQVISQVAFYLAERGEEISVLCSRNRYDGSQRGVLAPREVIDGVAVRRCWGPSLPRRFPVARVLNMISFCVSAAIRALVAPRVDAVVLMTDPPLFSVVGSLLKRLRGERFVYVLMDVYPQVAVQAGVLKDRSPAERVFRRVARTTLREADAVVVLGEDMKEEAIRSGASPDKVIIIRNWSDPERIFPFPGEKNRFRRELGLEGKFVIEYSGNLGVSHYFEDLLSVAEELRDHEDIRLLFVGNGVRLSEVKEFVAQRQLENVAFLPYQDFSVLAESLSAGDVHFVSLRSGFEGLVVPSKVYGIMASGKPVIYQGERSGEVARMVEREGIGFVIPPGDRDGLRDRILLLYRDRAARERMGEAARQALLEKYSVASGLVRYRRVLAPGDTGTDFEFPKGKRHR